MYNQIAMNIEHKNLRIAVVPTETGNHIDQSSSVIEILACNETILFSVFDYFKAQNDDDLPQRYWSFVIDIVNNLDLTGENIKGINF